MKYLKKTCAVTLSAAMILGMASGMGTVSSAAANIEKEETVYVNQEADGSVTDITVSDWLKNVTGNGDISDMSKLTDIKNVKGDEIFTQGSDGTLTWQADNADIYYQGKSDEELPVGVKVSYKLDGKEIKAADMAGKSGKVTITIQYENKASYEDEIDGRKVELNTPFLMASAVILPVDNFSNVTVNQGKLVSEGSNQILVVYGMPGLADSLDLSSDLKEEMDEKLGDTVTITADVTDFSMGSIYTVATSDEFSDIDLDDDSDINDVENAINDLADATDELISGSSDLSDGLTTLQNNFKTYANGVEDVKKGASDLSTGAGKLSKGVSQYTTGVTSLTKGASQYVEGTKSLANGVTAYVNGEKQIDAGVTKLYNSVGALSQYSEFSGKLTSYVGGVNDLANGVKNVSGKLSNVGAALTSYGNAAETLKNAKVSVSDKSALESAIDGSDLEDSVKTQLKQLLSDVENENAAVETARQTILGTNAEMQKTLGSVSIPDSDTLDYLISSGNALTSASSQFDAGIRKLNDEKEGVPALYAGVKALSENNADLLKGASDLAAKGGDLTTGIGTLNQSTKTLTSSAKQLSEGAGTLSKGADKLNGATKDVSDGVDKLQSGSVDLLDGMNQFKDEGTGKLQREYNDNIKNVIERFQSLTAGADDYKTFSGIADGMEGKVKFIFQTEEISADKD